MQVQTNVQVQHVTGAKVLDTILAYVRAARYHLIAKYQITTFPPDLVLKQAYILIEQSKLPRTTKYRYKAFLRELAKEAGIGNIRVRKLRFEKGMKKYSREAAKALKSRLTKKAKQSYSQAEEKIQKIYEGQEYNEGREELPAWEGAEEAPEPLDFGEEEHWGAPASPGHDENNFYEDYNIASYMDWEE